MSVSTAEYDHLIAFGFEPYNEGGPTIWWDTVENTFFGTTSALQKADEREQEMLNDELVGGRMALGDNEWVDANVVPVGVRASTDAMRIALNCFDQKIHWSHTENAPDGSSYGLHVYCVSPAMLEEFMAICLLHEERKSKLIKK